MRVALLEEDENQIAYLTNILSQIPMGDDRIVCQAFSSAQRLRSQLRQETYDMLILDWNMPDMEGLDLVQWLRNFQKNDMPVVMLTARSSEQDIAKAFGSGADDYVVKPLRPVEFSARVARLLRKKSIRAISSVLTFGDWTFYRANTTARITEGDVKHEVKLTEREFRLAVALFQHMGSPISRLHLLEYSGVSGRETGSRALDSHIYRLRGKLLLDGSHGIHLQTVYGHGYRLDWATDGAPEVQPAAAGMLEGNPH